MFCNPLARLVGSLVLFLVLIILLDDWCSIIKRGFADRKRNKNK